MTTIFFIGECIRALTFPYATYHVEWINVNHDYVVREILDGREYNKVFVLYGDETDKKRFKKVDCPKGVH